MYPALSKLWFHLPTAALFIVIGTSPASLLAQETEGEPKDSQANQATSTDSEQARQQETEKESTDDGLLSTEEEAALEEAMEENEVNRAVPVLRSGIDGVPYDDVGTAESAALEAAGDLSRDAGAARLLRSRAAINLQAATEEYLENQVAYTKAYLAKRKAWMEMQKQQREDRVDEEEAEKIAATRAPERLSADYFNRETGEILWPPVLDSKPLKSLRTAIERQFKRRSSPGYEWSMENVRWVQANVAALQKAIDTVKPSLPLETYVSASQMLESIEWEAEHDGNGERVTLTADSPTPAS